jgi:hypothetical protein
MGRWPISTSTVITCAAGSASARPAMDGGAKTNPAGVEDISRRLSGGDSAENQREGLVVDPCSGGTLINNRRTVRSARCATPAGVEITTRGIAFGSGGIAVASTPGYAL